MSKPTIASDHTDSPPARIPVQIGGTIQVEHRSQGNVGHGLENFAAATSPNLWQVAEILSSNEGLSGNGLGSSPFY
jgi:hypothetical protein